MTGMSEGDAAADWQAVLDGDKEAFNRLIEPLVPELVTAAREELAYFVEIGDIPPDRYAVEDILAEAVLRAWRNRRRRPSEVSLKAWLLAILYRILDDIAARERRRRELAEEAREQHPEIPPFEDEDAFWEWFQPDDLPLAEPFMPEEPPSPEEIATVLETRPRAIGTAARRALVMHRRHGIAIGEISAVLRRSVAETRALIEEAGRRVREQRKAD